MGMSCSQSVKDQRITADNQAEIYDTVQNSNQLTGEELRLLEAYLQRNPPPDGNKLPIGTTLAELITAERVHRTAQGTASADADADAGSPQDSAAADSSAPSKPADPPRRDSAASGNRPSTPSADSTSSGSSPSTPAEPSEQEASEAAPQLVEVSAGTKIRVRLDDRLSSKENQSGDTFRATLEDDLRVGDHLVAAKGSRLVGRLSNVQKSGKVKGRATLSMTLNEIRVEGGDSYPFPTSTLAFQAEGSKKEDAKKIGIGAGVGAVIGAIAGGGKGAAIGAAIGGGAGAGATLLTSGDEVEFSVEQLFEFKLGKDIEMKPVS